MAITVQFQGDPVQPVYQPFFFQVTSSNVAQPQFRYVFDVYKDGTFIERVKMLPNPTTNLGVFSPARILESYLSYDIAPTSTNPVQANSMCRFWVRYGEEYGALGTPPVTYPNLATSSGFTYNGVVQYKDYYWQENGGLFQQHLMRDYSTYPSSGRFLTNAPTAITLSTTDYHTLSAWNFDSADLIGYGVPTAGTVRAIAMVLNCYPISGGSPVTKAIYFPTLTGASITNKEAHFPSGPVNLNQIGAGQFLAGVPPAININTEYAYEIFLMDMIGPIVNQRISEARRFEFETCGKYDNVRIKFLNRLGGWDYFNFRLVSRSTVNTDRSTFKKNLPLSYYYGNTASDREQSVFNSVVNKTVTVTSDWVNDETSTWLEELWTSPEAYEYGLDSFGNTFQIPIVITTTSQEIKKRINEQIFNYELQYTYASNINVQRS